MATILTASPQHPNYKGGTRFLPVVAEPFDLPEWQDNPMFRDEISLPVFVRSHLGGLTV
jgi:hypothetical protein